LKGAPAIPLLVLELALEVMSHQQMLLQLLHAEHVVLLACCEGVLPVLLL
jgi:hypothetical protein